MKCNVLIIGPTPAPRVHTSRALPPTSTIEPLSPSSTKKTMRTASEPATEMTRNAYGCTDQRPGHEPMAEAEVVAPTAQDGPGQ